MSNTTPIAPPQSVALQNLLSAARAALALVGTYLIGHAIFGHTVTADIWQVLVGAASTIIGLVWGIVAKTSTIEGIESSVRSILAGLGGLGVSAGVISNSQLLAALAAIIPIATVVQSALSKAKNQQIATGATVISATTLKAVSKSAAIILILLCAGVMANAQEGCDLNPADSAKYTSSVVWYWSIPELKESAKVVYFNLLDMVNQKIPYTKDEFEKALNRYAYWRKLVDLKLGNKKDRDDFHNWIASQARTAGKLTYNTIKTSK